jgi:hypothetical protein
MSAASASPADSDPPLVQRALAGTAQADRCGRSAVGLRTASGSEALSPPGSGARTHAERIIGWALATGKPLEQRQWILDPPDGGPPLLNLRSRVSDLERAGYRWKHIRRQGHVEYLLAGLPPDEPRAAEQLPLAIEDAA